MSEQQQSAQTQAQSLAQAQQRADAQLEALLAGLEPQQAALALAVLAHRAAARLHACGRGEATGRKGQAEWAAWAQLQNAARALVLASSTCRDLAARLGARAESAEQRAAATAPEGQPSELITVERESAE